MKKIIFALLALLLVLPTNVFAQKETYGIPEDMLNDVEYRNKLSEQMLETQMPEIEKEIAEVEKESKSNVKEDQNKKDLKLYINGSDVDWKNKKVDYFIQDNRTFVPLRFVCENLGIQVEWDAMGRRVYLGDRRVGFEVGDDKYILHDKVVKMDVAPLLKNDRTYVPIRFVAEALNIEVEWNQKTRSAYIGPHLGQEEMTLLISHINEENQDKEIGKEYDYTIVNEHEDDKYFYQDVDIEIKDKTGKTAYTYSIGKTKEDEKWQLFQRSYFTSGDKLVPVATSSVQ